ncbi:MAG: FMN-binding protein [Bacilli bacterium]|nr:FMN-binding protein [Bacilli bacterium]
MNKKCIFIGIILIIIGFCITFKIVENRHKQQLSDLTINNVDLELIPNGTYGGSYNIFPVSVKVEVTVIEHVITKINLIKHIHGRGKAAETLTDKVVAEQSLEIDVVTGATASSKVILKAIEQALVNGIK